MLILEKPKQFKNKNINFTWSSLKGKAKWSTNTQHMLCCINHFCECHKKAITIHDGPFAIAIDARSLKGIVSVAREGKVYDFRVHSIICDKKDPEKNVYTEMLEDRAKITGFLKWTFQGLSCNAVGIKKTKQTHTVIIQLSRNTLSYQVQGLIRKP